ncbi:MAG: glycerol-3-phosphate dehydrogenase/oxidase [Thermoplasmata archaeon]
MLLKREDIINEMEKGLDVVIIGGGITGAGILNALSKSRLKIGLLEARDYSIGTSSRSSKLIHGGLRYLENFQFSVVKDSVRERDFLLENSRSVGREDFLIPMDDYSWNRFEMFAGMKLYSLFSKKIRATWYSRDEIIKKYPHFSDIKFRGGYIYAEGVVDDSRLVMDNIMNARINGALSLNYAKVTGIDFTDDHYIIEFEDTINKKNHQTKARMIINSAGIWVNDIFEMLSSKFSEMKEYSSMLRMSKGDHIIIPREFYSPEVAIALRSSIDRRQVFIIPRGEVVIIGTTETRYEGDKYDPKPSEEEIDYLIKSVSRYVKFGREDIINSYSGIRPLFGKGEDLGKISREYRIIKNGRIINVVGGKLTTYRSVAFQILDSISKEFSLNLGRDLELNYIPDYNLIKDTDPEIRKFRYYVEYEQAYHIDDILWRREGHYIFSKDSGLSKVDRAWEAIRTVNPDENEKENYRKIINR